jgi:hypothetical protein
MKSKSLKGVVLLSAVLALAAAAFFFLRGPTGATTDYGGEIESTQVPEFLALDATRWVNGTPTSLKSLHGDPVLIEAWSPS